jgi:hypothetical protein
MVSLGETFHREEECLRISETPGNSGKVALLKRKISDVASLCCSRAKRKNLQSSKSGRVACFCFVAGSMIIAIECMQVLIPSPA